MYLSNSQGVAILKHCKHVFTNILSLATPLKFYEDLHIFLSMHAVDNKAAILSTL